MTAAITESALPQPASTTVDSGLGEAAAQASIRAARSFYAFWDTGDPAHLDTAIAPSFHDSTLPAGRPQGPQGPRFASQQFRAAVPDLRCAIDDLLVVGDKVTARLRFTGSFTGTFGGQQGGGQPIDFLAIDILRIADGKVVENWHLEDNLTLMIQLGVVEL